MAAHSERRRGGDISESGRPVISAEWDSARSYPGVRMAGLSSLAQVAEPIRGLELDELPCQQARGRAKNGCRASSGFPQCKEDARVLCQAFLFLHCCFHLLSTWAQSITIRSEEHGIDRTLTPGAAVRSQSAGASRSIEACPALTVARSKNTSRTKRIVERISSRLTDNPCLSSCLRLYTRCR